MGTLGATTFAASDRLLTKVNLRVLVDLQRTTPVELGLGEDHQTTQLVVVEFFHRVQQIAVEGHQATESGANSLVDWRRSVRVHPWGGVIRSAWLPQSEYP